MMMMKVRITKVIGLCLPVILASQSTAFVVPDGPRNPIREDLSTFTSPSTAVTIKEDIQSLVGSYRYPDLPTSTVPQNQMTNSFWGPVLSASFLVTSSTVGAGCLVMPEIAAGPGLAITAQIFGTVYLINLVSGLLLAEVAIKQKEGLGFTSGNNNIYQAPSSFKELAEANLNSRLAANVISMISLFTSGCIQAFNISRAGILLSGLCGGWLAAEPFSMIWAALTIALLSSQSAQSIAKVASVCAAALFLSFGGLLLPGVSLVTDPLATWNAPGMDLDWAGSVAHAAPIILMSMVYQNIVPTITKVLDYDRTKIVTAIVVGSFIPLTMYLAWCYVCLGGGIDTSLSAGGWTAALVTLFSFATLAGSTLGSSISLAQEMNHFVPAKREVKGIEPPAEAESISSREASLPKHSSSSDFGLSSAAAAIGIPLAAALAFSSGDGFTEALSLAGSFGTPVLYGAIPVAMAWKQRTEFSRHQQNQHMQPNNNNHNNNLVPASSLPVLGAVSVGFMGQEVLKRVGEILAIV